MSSWAYDSSSRVPGVLTYLSIGLAVVFYFMTKPTGDGTVVGHTG